MHSNSPQRTILHDNGMIIAGSDPTKVSVMHATQRHCYACITGSIIVITGITTPIIWNDKKIWLTIFSRNIEKKKKEMCVTLKDGIDVGFLAATVVGSRNGEVSRLGSRVCKYCPRGAIYTRLWPLWTDGRTRTHAHAHVYTDIQTDRADT